MRTARLSALRPSARNLNTKILNLTAAAAGLVIFGLLPGGVNVARADIYNCNGKWQNKPCDNGEASQTIEEHSRDSGVLTPPAGFPGGPKPMRTEEPPAPDAKPGEKAETPKGKDEVKTSKCPEGQTFTTSRPKAEADFQYYPENAGKASGKLRVEGTVKGHGPVKLALTLRQPDRGEERQAWSKNVSLPDEGGEEKFSKTVDLPVGASYLLTAVNSGSFHGYCAPAGAAEKKGDE